MINLNLIFPEIFISITIMFLLIVGVFKKNSSLIIYNLFYNDNFQNIYLIIFFLIIIYTHKQNILRIKDKKETKIKF